MINLKKAFKTALGFAAIFAASQSALALSTATLGDFSGGETVVDFNIIGDTVAITNQYAGSAVNFAGALVGMTNPGDTNLFNGSTIASNWNYNGPGLLGSVWTATFDTLQTIVGFWSESNRDDGVTIEAFRNSISIGSIFFPNPNDLTVDFLGVMDNGGFDEIVVTTQTNDNGFFAMDDFRFESDVNRVPDTSSTIALLGLSVLALAGIRRRK